MPRDSSCLHRGSALLAAFIRRCRDIISARRASGTHPSAAAPNAPSSPRRKDALFPAFSQRRFSAERSSAFRRAAAALAVTLLTALPAPAEEDDFAGVLAIVNGQALPIAEAQAQFDDYAPPC